MPLSTFKQGFKYGVAIRGIPIIQTHPGRVFWVYNGTTLVVNQKNGSNGNDGSWNAPFATIQYALTQCNANAGDIVFIKPGHAETITSASVLVLNKAGVAIVGLGTGSNRPTLTFTTATTANIPVTAANMAVAAWYGQAAH